MKPLIIGEAPSKNEDPEKPIEGRIGKRLAACAGLKYDEFLVFFERVNLLHERQEVVGKGFVFELPAAREAAHKLEETFQPGQIILLLGGRVAEAFAIHDEYFTKHEVKNEAVVYIMPHPSGVNRWWNDPGNHKRASEFMQWVVATVETDVAPV